MVCGFGPYGPQFPARGGCLKESGVNCYLHISGSWRWEVLEGGQIAAEDLLSSPNDPGSNSSIPDGHPSPCDPGRVVWTCPLYPKPKSFFAASIMEYMTLSFFVMVILNPARASQTKCLWIPKILLQPVGLCTTVLVALFGKIPFLLLPGNHQLPPVWERVVRVMWPGKFGCVSRSCKLPVQECEESRWS